uniref:Paralemmin-1 n=1 Tax=Oryzias sinensis TaxID=183150 RepID=A0A8C7WTK2_9TELE
LYTIHFYILKNKSSLYSLRIWLFFLFGSYPTSLIFKSHRNLSNSVVFVIPVLGMLEVQVERDPKTGVTVVRSVTPVSAPAAAPKATPIFDDGRKSIHTVGGSPGQPSSEELRQILSAQPKTLDRKKHLEAKQKIEKEPLNVGYEDNQTTTVVIDNEVKLDSQNLEENPVTLLFLGYADDPDDPSQEDPEGMITVERVMITEDGEETLLGHETPSSLQSASGQEAEQERDTETPVQNPPNAAEDERGVGIKPPKEEEEACKGKQKTCKCCSVM